MASARVIMPKGSVFKPQQIGNIIKNTLTAIAKDIKVDFDVTTQTWTNRPAVTIITPGRFQREIAVHSDVYAMLDAGTKPHLIRPRKARILRFNVPFRSKTLPGKIMSRAGSKGNTPAVARVVHHPGTQARQFAKTIARKWEKQVPIIFQRAIDAEYSR